MERGRLLSLDPWKLRTLLYYIIRCNSADRRRAFLLGYSIRAAGLLGVPFLGCIGGSFTSTDGRRAFFLGLLHRCRFAWCVLHGLQLGSYTSASGRTLEA